MPEFPPLVQALLNPRTYPDRPGKVELVQTQISFVFLTGDYVYKVKKPVDLGYLDYTTLEKRRFFCHQEVLLNRRLCPDVYLGVVSISQDKGEISFGEKGEVIEYAVKMRQLPRERTLDRLLSRNQVSREMIERVAQKLVAFHQKVETSQEIASYGSRKTIETNTEENFSQTERYVGVTIFRDKYERIKACTDSFMEENASLFGRRIEEGRVRDCHGDLHAAHICFSDGICIFDCIEFNERFRYADVASEVAFLAMDLDYHGRRDLSRIFVETYAALSQDRELLQLLDFYKCYRAYVRGKVESFKLDDPLISEAEKERTLAVGRGYFDLAYSYIAPAQPTLFITAGLVGTGKSALAEALARRMDLVVISSDVTRKRLAQVPAGEHRFEGFEAGIYSPEFSQRTYEEMFREARRILEEGRSVVIDASFKKRAERKRAAALAGEMGGELWVLECVLPEPTVKERLARRLEEGKSPSDGRWEIFEEQRGDFDPVVEAPPSRHIVIDTSPPVETVTAQLLNRLQQRD